MAEPTGKALHLRVPFGDGWLRVTAPAPADILEMGEETPLPDPPGAVLDGLENPIGSRSLARIIREKGEPSTLKAVVVVSDITRPVPYAGPKGILPPLLRYLEEQGIPPRHILLLVATGMHRPSTAEEKVSMYGRAIVERYAIEDHRCDDPSALVAAGMTRQGTRVSVNRSFLEADLRICTGLVESHFMAGFSGGRKAVCPGLVDKNTLERFHGPSFLSHPRADNLCLEGNPCHEEAMEVAALARIDFLLNVTVDRNFRVTGVYGGDPVKAHLAACEAVRRAVTIPIGQAYDIVLTHGGYVGVNHYQTAKAACAALPALKEGGTLIIAAHHRETDPVGSPEYRSLLALLRQKGPDGYVKTLHDPGWSFTKDQWEPQMWGRVLAKTGAEGLIYCTPHIPESDFSFLPGVSGRRLLARTGAGERDDRLAEAMVEAALGHACNRLLRGRGEKNPSIAFLADGPYGIPVMHRPQDEHP